MTRVRKGIVWASGICAASSISWPHPVYMVMVRPACSLMEKLGRDALTCSSNHVLSNSSRFRESMLRGKSTWNVPPTPEFATVRWPRTTRGARSLGLCDRALTPREGAGAASPTPAPSAWGAVVVPGGAFAVGASAGRATLEQTCRWDVKGTPSESLDGRTGHREGVPAGLTLDEGLAPCGPRICGPPPPAALSPSQAETPGAACRRVAVARK